MFNFLKKKIPAEEIASDLYMLFIRDTVKDIFRDSDGNILLNKNEQSLLLLSHLCDLLESNNLKNVKHKMSKIAVIYKYRAGRYLKTELHLRRRK